MGFVLFLAVVVNVTPIKIAMAMTIQEYMQVYKSKNSLLRSNEMSVEALQGKVDAADIDLSPMLSLGYLKGDDYSLPNQLSPHRMTEQFTAGLSKKFFTGTSVELVAKSYRFNNSNTPPLFPGYDYYSTGVLGISIKQSLWRDFFGTGTRTKIERQKSAAKLETTVADLRMRGLLFEAESVFWDYVAAQEEVRLKKANLERANKVQKWTARRYENGISEKADDLNAKALVSLREMELLVADNEYKNAEVKFRENLELTANERTPVVTTNWKETRPYLTELKNQKNIVKVEAYILTLEARTKALAAEETVDNLRPDLSLFGTYNYTSYERDREKAVSNMSRSDYPQSVVGVNFTWIIDNKAQSGLRQSMTQEASAAKLKADKNISDGLKSWEEYLRIYDVTVNQAKILDQIADLQKRRSDAENERFSKGRTVTAEVVKAETDAAESETRALRAKVGLRKYEASSLMYMPSDLATDSSTSIGQ